MSNTGLIKKLLRRLWQVLAALAHSSAQRLRILVSFLRCCATEAHALPGHSADAKSSTADSCCSGAFSARCSQATLPLPLHRQITPTSTSSGIQYAASSSTPLYPMPVPCIPERVIPSCSSSPPEVNVAIPSDAPGATLRFVPFAANDVLRYDNRPLVYVQRLYDSGQS